jgi:uncharacterized protein YdhG (YjbR/CyaY superfamily)
MAPPKPQYKTIDEYVDAFPDDVKTKLQALRQVIKEEAPEAKETIKYGMPTFTWRGNLVYFAAWKKHIALYPTTSAMEAAIEEMASYKMSGKGTIQFPLNQPLPLPLIRQIVAFRVKEMLEKTSS